MVQPIAGISLTDPPPRPPHKAAPVEDDPLDDPMLLAFAEVLGEELVKVRNEVAQGALDEMSRGAVQADELRQLVTNVEARLAQRISDALQDFKRFVVEESSRAEVLGLTDRLDKLTAQHEAVVKTQAAIKNEMDASDAKLADKIEMAVMRHGPTLEQNVRAQVLEDLTPKLVEIERSATVAVQAAMPAPRDGRDGRDGKDGKDGRDGKDGEAGTDGTFDEPKAWSGAAARGALITHRGGTWLAERDTANEPGDTDWKLLVDGIHRVDLEPGSPGELSVILELSSGEVKRQTVRVPGNVYRGVWTRKAYLAGDSVTHQGSTWITERDTEARPGDEDSGWRLAVKRGSDGRDGLSIEFKGLWSAGEKYKHGDVTKAPGGAYIALRNTSASPPLRTERNDDWQLIVPFPVKDAD